MTNDKGQFLLSAADLTRYLSCRHLTELDRSVAEGGRKAPKYNNPTLAFLQERGQIHEEAYVKRLSEQKLKIVDLRGRPSSETMLVLRAGPDIITQAELRDGVWMGRADILRRVNTPSQLGKWSYEVVDTKLAHETQGATVLQLCLYTDLLGNLQGLKPAKMHVVSPGESFPEESLLFTDFHAYYRLIRKNLESVLVKPPSRWTRIAESEFIVDNVKSQSVSYVILRSYDCRCPG